MKSPSPAKEHMMCSFRRTTCSGDCHLRVARHLVRSEFHPAYPIALSDDSSRETPTGERTFEARRPRRLLRTLHRVQLQDKNRQQFDPTHLSTASYFVMYAENNTYARERRTKLGLPPLPAQTKLSWSSDSLEQMAEIEWKPAADVIRITPLFTNSRYSPILFWSRLPVPSFANQNQTESRLV